MYCMRTSEEDGETQMGGLFEMQDRFQDGGVIFVAPKLRRIENVIGRQLIFCQFMSVGRSILHWEAWRRERKNSDPFVGNSVKDLHFFPARLGSGDDKGRPS